MDKPEYEEIEINLNEHDVEIFSKAQGYVEVKVDGKSLGTRRVAFDAPFFNTMDDVNKKTLKVIVTNPKHLNN
ncbi:hypothetical protein D3P96_02795 [Weissella viridescens]|uniref:Uncharacterized protein n=1 Tax=Weissella viridescens TaxID=1629 RepID=A0A3P2RC97_WEIVI|nr:hypothetical protein [Weissella viridescens]RRG18233.1 hypothetical protein D3P96_02795 [Weissella viridescens]